MIRVPRVERDLDRCLALLRSKINHQGFTQLEVQETLGWGRSYISQLLQKQKSLRVSQLLAILKVIGVEPGAFFAELYVASPRARRGHGKRGRQRPSGVDKGKGQLWRELEQLSKLHHGLKNLLVQKQLVTATEVSKAAKAVAVELSLREDLR